MGINLYRKNKAFSLIELMVIFAVLAILVSLLQPSLTRLLSHSNTNLCKNQLRVIFSGISIYTESHDGRLPGPSYSSQTPRVRNNKGHLDKNLARYLSTYFEVHTDNSNNQYLKEFICPSNEELSLTKSLETRTHFLANSKNRYFGYPKTSYSGAQKDPKKATDVEDPSGFWAITDADRVNAGWIKSGQAPDLPLHTDISRNYLYFDGHLDNLVYK